MLQYKVPQNVGIEDRVVGPLTLRQLIILAVGTGISYMIFVILNRIYELNILEYLIIGLPALIAAAAALIRINDISFTKFLILLFEFGLKPKKRVWDHRAIVGITAPELNEKEDSETAKKDQLSAQKKKPVNLSQLSQIMDSGGFGVQEVSHEDIDKTNDSKLLTQAFFGHKTSDTDNMYWRTQDSHKELLKVMAQLETLSKYEQKALTQTKSGEGVKEAEKMAISRMKQEAATATLPKPTSKPATPAQAPANPQTESEAKKKRRRKKKPSAVQPVRENVQINTLKKDQPIQYIQKPQQTPAPEAPLPKGSPGASGEIDFRELEKGEIEINLD